MFSLMSPVVTLLVLAVLAVLAIVANVVGALTVVAVLVIALLVIALLGGTLSGIFTVALYRSATTGDAAPSFPMDTLNNAFRVK